jgi:hypothetical protein
VPVIDYTDTALRTRPRPKELRGIFVGGCMLRGDGSRMRAQAHAHTHDWNGIPCRGWICVGGALNKRGGPKLQNAVLMIHELAHLVSLSGHTDKWRKALTQLGKDYDVDMTKELENYRKVPRKRCQCGKYRSSTPAATWWFADPVYLFHSWNECRRKQ